MPKAKCIAQLRRELAATQRQLVRLRWRRAKLGTQLARLDRQIADLTGGPAAAPAAKKRAAPKRKAKTARKAKGKPRGPAGRRQRSLAQVIQDVLAKATKPMQARDITAAVLKAGYKTKDKNFRATVAQRLAKSPQFNRLGRGVYKLAAK